MTLIARLRRSHSDLRRAILPAALVLLLLHGCNFFEFAEPHRLAAERNGPCGSGTDSCGAGQICYQVTSLGGENFCTDVCDPAQPTDAEHVCEQNGALLTRCHPNGATDAADCPVGLNCYRTSLLRPDGMDTGVCLKIPVCREDKDCSGDEKHPTCATSLIKDSYGGAELPNLDHMNCVTYKCKGSLTSCATSERCLGAIYQTPSADLCTPDCDADRPCPPNFGCTVTISGEESAHACVPGTPGTRCVKDHCLVGSCVDTGAGFSVCTTPCASHEDCQWLNSLAGRFQCSDLGQGKFCVTPLPFHGANCLKSEECRSEIGEICSAFSDTGVHLGHRECRVPCKADHTCEPRGGLPHVCREEDGSCYPGQLGLPCKASSECFDGLTCQVVSADDELDLPEQRLCTMPCGNHDSVCDPSAGFNDNGYCSAGFCRIKREDGTSCRRSEQCISGLCVHGMCLASSSN